MVAITSTASKQEEALQLGAHRVVVSNDTTAMASLACSLDMVLVTASASLNWDALIASLRANGRMHVVGMPLDAIPVRAMSLIRLQRSISGSPTGSPTTLATMLEFCARHSIAPQVEHFPMSNINTALQHLREGKARYRVVLCNNDLRGGTISEWFTVSGRIEREGESILRESVIAFLPDQVFSWADEAGHPFTS